MLPPAWKGSRTTALHRRAAGEQMGASSDELNTSPYGCLSTASMSHISGMLWLLDGGVEAYLSCACSAPDSKSAAACALYGKAG